MSSMKRRMARAGAKNPHAAQIMNLLSTLTPGLQEVEGQLKHLAPNLQQAQVEWDTILAKLQTEVADLRKQQEQNHSVVLMVLYEIMTGSLQTGLSFEEFVAHVRFREQAYQNTDDR